MEPQNPGGDFNRELFRNENEDNEVQNSLNMNMNIDQNQRMENVYANPSISDNSKENYTAEDIQREKALQRELDAKNNSSQNNNLASQNNEDMLERDRFINQGEPNNQDINNQINNSNRIDPMNMQNQNDSQQQNKIESNDNLNQNQNNINNNFPFSENPMQNNNNLANNNNPMGNNMNDINQNNIKNQNDNQNMNMIQQNNMFDMPNSLLASNNKNNPIMNQNSNNNNLSNFNNGNNNNNENNMNLNSQNNKNNMGNNMNNSMNNNASNMQLNNQNNINNNQISNMNNNSMSNMNNNQMSNMNNNPMNNMNNNPMGNMNNNSMSNMNNNQMSNMNNNPMNNMNNNQMSNMNNNPMGNMNQISNQNMGMQNQNMGMQNQNMNNNKEPYSFSRYKKASKTSLKNLGDTSYLNAVFQLLGTVRNLSSYFVNPKNKTSFEKNVNSAGFSYVVHRFFTHIYPYPEKQVPEKYKPEALLTYLGKLNKVYMSTKRRNPNDLITFCLNQLHRELNSCKTKHLSNPNFLDKDNVIKTRLNDYTKSNNSIIANNFHWFEIKTRYCGSCNTNFYEFKDFETLELDISEAYKQFKQPFTLLQCLTFQSKKFQNSFCQKCGIYTQNQILSNIYSSPITFIFSLNRGNLDPNLLNINFIVEENIDISQFLENKRSYSKYSLCGIVSISRKENNKYVCFGKSPVDKQWYLYNDEMVTDTNINYIINYNNNHEYIPCILLYQFIKQ